MDPDEALANALYEAVVQPDTIWWDDLTPEMQQAWLRAARQARRAPLNREWLARALAAHRGDKQADGEDYESAAAIADAYEAEARRPKSIGAANVPRREDDPVYRAEMRDAGRGELLR